MAKTGSIEDLLKPAKPSVAPAAGNGKAAKQPVKASATKPTTQKETLEEQMGAIKLREKEKLAERAAAEKGLPYVALRGFPIAPEAISLIPRETAQKLHVIAFFLQQDDVRIATTTPGKAVDELAADLGKKQHAKVQVYLISEDSLDQGLQVYNRIPTPKEVIYGYRIEAADLERYAHEMESVAQLQEKITTVSTTDIVTLMIGAALKADASDIHVEAEEDAVKIRFRLDGILSDAAKLPRETWKHVIGRLKLLAGVKINVEKVPQDGRITIYLPNEKIDIRVSFLPTSYGESVVMRILRPKSIALEFSKLGIRPQANEELIREMERPNGMIITTGPTGSGKTTTLYAMLKKLNGPDVKIITLEDPIEYKLEGINQSQIEHGKHYDFASGLRSLLRQDPDIVMVGEIRDLETAEVAIQAALTGHLMLSTIHTNSASGAIPRFLSMGVKPFLLSPAINAIIGQRLVRRLCEKCKKPIKLEQSVMEKVKQQLETISPASKEKPDLTKLAFFGPGEGCSVCHGIGYKGRIGIYEIMTMNEELEAELLKPDVSEHRIQEIALNHGMVTMTQDGLLKALDGLTSVDEVLRVADIERKK